MRLQGQVVDEGRDVGVRCDHPSNGASYGKSTMEKVGNPGRNHARQLKTAPGLVEDPPQSPPYIIFICIGWVGVGWQRHCKTCRSPRELDDQGTNIFFGGRRNWRSS